MRARSLLDWLLPWSCLGCGGTGATPDRLGLCRACAARLRRPPAPACALCGEPFPGLLGPTDRCAACRRRPPAYGRLLTGYSYEGSMAEVIAALKFRRMAFLGSALAESLGRELAGRLPEVDVVAVVPLHWRRRLRRGYDQAESVARPLARGLGLPYARLLRRQRPTPPQSLLERAERAKNVRGAFTVPRPDRVRGRAVLLVDDVVTTGATLHAAAAALRRAGAARVVAVAVARTPSPRRPGPGMPSGRPQPGV